MLGRFRSHFQKIWWHVDLKEGIKAVLFLQVTPHGSSMAWSYGHLKCWVLFWVEMYQVTQNWQGTRTHDWFCLQSYSTQQYREYSIQTRSAAWVQRARGWPSYYNIPSGVKNVGIRIVQICVRKLVANSSVFRVFECAALPLQRVTAVVKLVNTENIFLRTSWEFGK